VADCELCLGRGWVVAADGGNGLARRCNCRLELPLRERLAAAGVWTDHLYCSRETWRGEWPAGKLRDFGKTRHFCTVIGPVGSGKTHLATAILGEWLLAGGRGLWRESSTTVEEIKRGMRSGSGDRLIDELKSGERLLVLDDLLTEQGTDWTEFLLSHVLRYRQGRHLPTVITANVADLADLDAIEPRLSSRCGAGIVIGLTGADRRTAAGAE
jgi:chromosomal replication initiation ATPase DnaA